MYNNLANREYETKRRKICRDYAKRYREEHPCSYCGETDTACLDFHHTNPELKEYTVSRLISKGKLYNLKQEIERCIILCANCHRKRHIDGFPASEVATSFTVRAIRRRSYRKVAQGRCRDFLVEFKNANPCSCGEAVLVCLDLHHRNPNEKDDVVTKFVSKGQINKLKEEIAKCIVLCANCHRKHHAREST